MCRASRASDRTTWSPSPRGSDPSITTINRSASAASRLARSTPRDSMASVDARIPAVSVNRTGTPLMSIHSVSVSLVVPGISVTMARSCPSKLLNRLDLPTFGRPTKATLIPSRRSRPERNVRTSRDKSAVRPRSESRILSCSSAGRSSSTNSSEDSRRTIIFRRSSFAG